MTKKILTIAIAIATMFSLSSFAQTSEKNCRGSGKCVKSEKCEGEKECKKAGKKEGKNGEMKKCANPFAGIELTADQQTKLNAIPTPGAVMKASKTENTSKQVNPREFAKTVRLDYLKQVQQVLTPAQYVKFLENNFVNQRPGKGGKDMKKGHHDMKKGSKDMKKDGKGRQGQRGEKGSRKGMNDKQK